MKQHPKSKKSVEYVVYILVILFLTDNTSFKAVNEQNDPEQIISYDVENVINGIKVNEALTLA